MIHLLDEHSAVGVAILQHKLVNTELLVLPAQEPNSNWLILGGLSDGLPNIALIKVHLHGLGDVQVFGRGMAIVYDELYLTRNAIHPFWYFSLL